MVFYVIWQCTWGILQTLVGMVLFLIYRRNRHFNYHGAIVTEWDAQTSVSLGLFIFVTADVHFARNYKEQLSAGECAHRLLVHEYGHTIQSLMLGPLYLIVIGIPSVLWLHLGAKKRKKMQIAYGAFFTERWANRLGERVTGEESIGDMILD